MKDIIIAIDGYSSCGKSTLAKDIAKILNYKYIDSGAMYRAAALFCLQNGIINEKEVIDYKKLESEIDKINIDLIYNQDLKKIETFLNNVNVEKEIREIKVSNYVSAISKVKIIREKMVNIQRNIAINKRIVMDGRDIGTVVFPNAELKIFMTADVKVRAQRRFDEYRAKKVEISFKEVEDNIQKRDYIDENREESPLRKPIDAIVLDNSQMSMEEQLKFILDIIKERFQ